MPSNIMGLTAATRLTGTEQIYAAQANLDRRIAASQINAGVVITDPPSGGDDTAMLQACLDESFGSVASPNGSALNYNNRPLIIRGGRYFTTAPLQVKYLHGGRIIGAGRGATRIENQTANSDVFRTNGCAYSRFEGIVLKANGTGRCVDLDWDGTAGGAALQSNTFQDMLFDGGNIGVHIGRSEFMGSECLFSNCFWSTNAVAGLLTSNANALQHTVIGGNFQLCGIGIWMAGGSVPIIHGVGFQLSTVRDIQIDYSAYDTVSIKGCRSESVNFLAVNAPMHVSVEAVSHVGGANGDFMYSPGTPVSITRCRVITGRIVQFGKARLHITGCMFDRQDWLSVYDLDPPAAGNYQGYVELDGVIYGLGAGEGPVTQIFKQRITSSGTFDYDSGSSVTELTTIAATAFTDTTIQIPAGTRVKGVTTRVTVAIPTATAFDVGVSGATTRYATGVAVAANTTDRGMLDGNTYYPSAVSIRITPNITPAANTGRVRVTVHYETLTPPLS